MDLREPSLRDIENCETSPDYQALQSLVEEARRIGAVVTVRDSLPRVKAECCGACRLCLYSDDCSAFSRNVLGNQDYISGVVIA